MRVRASARNLDAFLGELKMSFSTSQSGVRVLIAIAAIALAVAMRTPYTNAASSVPSGLNRLASRPRVAHKVPWVRTRAK